MQVLLLCPNAKSYPELRKKIRGLGARVSLVVPEDPFPALDGESAGLVTVVPEGMMDAPDWSSIRVRLAGAGRFYVVAGAGLDTARIVRAVRDGAMDVLDLEADPDDRWKAALANLALSQDLWFRVYGGLPGATPAGGLLGDSESTKSLRKSIQRIGPTDVSVLVMGESGTGKERVALALQEARGRGPFVALNCAAIPRDLLESELFGAEKGAFSGAWREKPGLVEQASGGTLFLDELGEMDILLQPKLLRFLETRTARRVGGTRDYQVKARIVSATNRNLESEIAGGRFRADLYYRLAEVIIQVSPLRTRLDDIPPLVSSFISGANERFGRHFLGAEPDLVDKFRKYPWPGNVRELKSVIDRLSVLHDGTMIRASWWEPPLPSAITFPTAAELPERVIPAAALVAATPPTQAPSRRERMALARVLLKDGNLGPTDIAARLGVHPATLFRWRQSGRV